MRNVLRLLPCLAIVLLAGCSSYGKRFTAAAIAPGNATQFAGAYSGRWMSASHPGGTGNLRCILTKVSDSDYNADFHATWHGFASEHSVVLHTKPAARKKSGAGLREFEGTSALRTLIGAGTYTCKGTVDPHGMQACYDATYDRGGFQMSRVRSGAALR